jgi:hypothetical protein
VIACPLLGQQAQHGSLQRLDPGRPGDALGRQTTARKDGGDHNSRRNLSWFV